MIAGPDRDPVERGRTSRFQKHLRSTSGLGTRFRFQWRGDPTITRGCPPGDAGPGLRRHSMRKRNLRASAVPVADRVDRLHHVSVWRTDHQRLHPSHRHDGADGVSFRLAGEHVHGLGSRGNLQRQRDGLRLRRDDGEFRRHRPRCGMRLRNRRHANGDDCAERSVMDEAVEERGVFYVPQIP